MSASQFPTMIRSSLPRVAIFHCWGAPLLRGHHKSLRSEQKSGKDKSDKDGKTNTVLDRSGYARKGLWSRDVPYVLCMVDHGCTATWLLHKLCHGGNGENMILTCLSLSFIHSRSFKWRCSEVFCFVWPTKINRPAGGVKWPLWR